MTEPPNLEIYFPKTTKFGHRAYLLIALMSLNVLYVMPTVSTKYSKPAYWKRYEKPKSLIFVKNNH